MKRAAATVMAGLIMAGFMAGTALAHTVLVSGTAVCDAQGRQVITWTVRNSQTTTRMTITGIALTPAGTTVSGFKVNDTLATGTSLVTGSTTAPGNTPVQLSITAKWSDGYGPITVTSPKIIPVGGCATLSVTKTADAPSVPGGRDIGFTVAVSNAGPSSALNVKLNDPLPSGAGSLWNVGPAYTGPGTCSINGASTSQTLACTLGNLAAGASASVHIVSHTSAGIPAPVTLTNVATASGDNAPPVRANASIVVTVPMVTPDPTPTSTPIPTSAPAATPAATPTPPAPGANPTPTPRVSPLTVAKASSVTSPAEVLGLRVSKTAPTFILPVNG